MTISNYKEQMGVDPSTYSNDQYILQNIMLIWNFWGCDLRKWVVKNQLHPTWWLNSDEAYKRSSPKWRLNENDGEHDDASAADDNTKWGERMNQIKDHMIQNKENSFFSGWWFQSIWKI